ncbi:hypothetical protein ODR30_25575 [Escherichia coli]|uniref:hypothetical protein n=1 Tax=Escherichia coli TaxID=562 RepID=UPI00050A8AA1|nr:hypothetical protein [Escherichia coli]MCI4986507.1 hypothetical protein [Escherichia coli]MCV7935529.1 hypothetical protein [Escherichia coli]MDF8445554.1 hypothetical protein [Escherichia coli]MDF8473388.1 hypothetical protein [Escherichia coli]MDF8603772.1 hypothetical protein [Escherichia coli]
MDITQASARHQACKAQFDTAMAKLSEQESLITNLEATIEQTKGELESLDRDWQNSILSALGAKTEASAKLCIQAGVARENLERLRVLHDEACIRLLECRYNAAEAGCAYQSIDNKLRAEIFAKALPGLINELIPALLLIRGLCELLGQPLYNAEKKICETLKVADIVESVGLIRGRINDIESDASNPLRYCPEKLPDSVSHAIRNAPSPVQWSAARQNPEKMRDLAEGRELCRGWQ